MIVDCEGYDEEATFTLSARNQFKLVHKEYGYTRGSHSKALRITTWRCALNHSFPHLQCKAKAYTRPIGTQQKIKVCGEHTHAPRIDLQTVTRVAKVQNGKKKAKAKPRAKPRNKTPAGKTTINKRPTNKTLTKKVTMNKTPTHRPPTDETTILMPPPPPPPALTPETVIEEPEDQKLNILFL